MKKSLFLLPLVAMFFASCSNDDPAINVIDPVEDSGEKSFLNVTLVAPSSASRAADADETYQDGTPSENQVNAVRFYFLDEFDKAAPAFYQSASGSYLSFIDWTPTLSEQKPGNVENQTVEKILNATLTVSKVDGKLPAKVIAIVNPTEALYADKSDKSLEEIEKLIDDYYTGLHTNNFVITNTTFVDKDGQTIVNPTLIGDDIYQPTEELAQEHKLIIYVERVLARLDLYLNIQEKEDTDPDAVAETVEDGLIKIGSYKVNDADKGIYLKLSGWNIVNTPKTSRLVKKINTWDEKLFDAEGLHRWNSSEYSRSFWAINPENVERSLGSYTVENVENKDKVDSYFAADKYRIPANGGKDYVTAYMQENAATDENGFSPADTDRSKVIFAGKIVDNEGKEIELVRWANRYYTEDQMLIAAANALDLYFETTVDGQKALDKIKPSDLQYVGVKDLKKAPADAKEYFSYIQLTDDAAKNKKWHDGKANIDENPLDAEVANSKIIDRINYVMYWKSGMTYYYIDIRHISHPGANYTEVEDQTKVPAGHFGVVRNHIYSSKITNIAGLGTPVFNPDQVIFPQTTETDDNIMAAEIRVLQWRIVNQDYDITWPK